MYWTISGSCFKVVLIIGYLTILGGMCLMTQQVLCVFFCGKKKHRQPSEATASA